MPHISTVNSAGARSVILLLLVTQRAQRMTDLVPYEVVIALVLEARVSAVSTSAAARLVLEVRASAVTMSADLCEPFGVLIFFLGVYCALSGVPYVLRSEGLPPAVKQHQKNVRQQPLKP